MNKTDKTAATNRVLSAVAIASLWLAGAGGGMAADAPAPKLAPQTGFAYERFSDTEMRILEESGSAPAIGPMGTKPNSTAALRFTGMLTPPADGEYVVRAEADTGVRVKLDSQLVIDGWAKDAARSGQAKLAKDKPVLLVVEYFFDKGKGGVNPVLRLFWTPPGGAETPLPAADETVVLDDTTLWRQYHVEGPSQVRISNGTLNATQIDWSDGGSAWHQDQAAPGDSGVSVTNIFGRTESRPDGLWNAPPPAEWTTPGFDDSAWPRLWWPQPNKPSSLNGSASMGSSGPVGGRYLFDTVLVLARGTFEVKDPAQVKACRLSLDYRGGVVVYVNGKEVARDHLPVGSIGPATPADDYPVEAFVGADKPIKKLGAELQISNERRALRDRQLRNVVIPASLLRPGRNVVAIEAHAAPIFENAVETLLTQRWFNRYEPVWPLVGLIAGRLTVSPASAAVAANRGRPAGLQVWNVAPYDTVTGFDYGNPADPLRPVAIRAGRNTVFSGRLIVGSDQPIKGLSVKVTDLGFVGPSLVEGRGQRPPTSGGPMGNAAKIPASAVRVRYAIAAEGDKSYVPGHRFDGLLDTIPGEIAVTGTSRGPQDGNSLANGVGSISAVLYNPRTKQIQWMPGAVAPLWFTVRVPRDAAPGLYEGNVTVTAEGLNATTVPLHVQVSAWTAPNPWDFRLQNPIYYAEELIPQYYNVPYWSDRHFEILGQLLSLLGEVNSRQVMANLVTSFFAYAYRVPNYEPPKDESNVGGESLVRWIKQPDGGYKHDFTNFDKYLDLVAKTIGKPNTLRLNFLDTQEQQWLSVTVLDPASGKLSRLKQPAPGTEESYLFWKPVVEETLRRIKARGWLAETTFGYNDSGSPPSAQVVDVAQRLWPEGEWSFSSHGAAEGMTFKGSAANVLMKVRHADTCLGRPSGKLPSLWTLDGPRRTTCVWTCRGQMDDASPLQEYRRQVERLGMVGGYDGVGDFGANQFPLKKPSGGYYIPAAGRGTRWCMQWAAIHSLLYPGPNGPVATERYEMLREGLELCEAILYVQNAIHKKQLSADLEQRAKRYLYPQEKLARMTVQVRGERDNAFNRGWFSAHYMMSVEDAKLLDLAGEVAQELEGKK